MKKIIVFMLCILSPLFLRADPKGEETAKKTYSLKKSDDTYASASMIIIDKNGNKKTRKLEMFTKKTPDGSNTFVNFIEPAEVKGTKFLTIARKDSPDEQRIYLPDLKKTRMISSSAKNGEFVGSDVWYYDMEDRSYEDHSYKFIESDQAINDPAFAGMKFNVIEIIDKDKDSPYFKAVAWVNADDNFIYKLEAYDKKDSRLLKTSLILEVKKTDGIIFPAKTLVINHKTGSKTLLSMDNIKINKGLDPNLFTVSNLEK